MIDRRELRRQILHLVLGSLFVIFVYFEWVTSWILFFMLVILGGLSYISTKHEIPLIKDWIDRYERPFDAKTFPGRGPIFMVVGVLLAIQLFPRDIALASIAILALGDSVSHIIGATFGKIKHHLNKTKLIEGSIIGTIAGGIGALAFVRPVEAFVGAFIAMMAEAIEVDMAKRPLDDNVIVPLVAGAIMLILRTLI